jgi:hypothetical protein
LPDIGCLGSDKAERSPQPRLVAVPIVPDNVKEHVTTEYPANGSSDLARLARESSKRVNAFARYPRNAVKAFRQIERKWSSRTAY